MIEISRPERAKIQALEGLRGVMAWWVVLGHVSLGFGWHLGIINHNTLPVDVFIYLSGFVISRLIDRNKEPYGAYLTRRCLRIFPLYLAVLFVSAGLLSVQLAAWQALPATPTTLTRIELVKAGYSDFPAHLLLHIFLSQGLIPERILPHAAVTLVGQAWSISLEMQFYFIAPFIMWCLARQRRISFLAISLVFLVAIGGHINMAFLGEKILQFSVGISTYMFFDRAENRKMWVWAGVFFGCMTIAKEGLIQLVPLLIWVVVISSIASSAHSWRHLPAKILSLRPFVHVGEISYSIYMTHMIMFFSSAYLAERLGVEPVALATIVVLSSTIGTYVVSLCTRLIIERPFDRIGKRLSGRMAAAPLPL